MGEYLSNIYNMISLFKEDYELIFNKIETDHTLTINDVVNLLTQLSDRTIKLDDVVNTILSNTKDPQVYKLLAYKNDICQDFSHKYSIIRCVIIGEELWSSKSTTIQYSTL
jgi:hypothetical protein